MRSEGAESPFHNEALAAAATLGSAMRRPHRTPTAKRPSETSFELTGNDKTKWILAASTAAAALALDLLSKRIVHSTMALGQPGVPGDEYRLLPFLSLQRASNSGVAFGLLSGRFAVIVPAACLALVLIFVYLALEPRPIIAGLAGGLLIGGSLGNLLERLTQGHVTDFLHIPHYPTFNLADVFIVVGVGLVAVSLLWGRTESRAVEGAHNG